MDIFQFAATPESIIPDGVDTLRKCDGYQVFPVAEQPVFNRPYRSEILELVEGRVAAVVAENSREGSDGIGFGIGELAVGVGVENGDQLRFEVLVHKGDIPGRDFILEIQVGVGCGQDAEDAPLDGQFLADGHDGGFGFRGEPHPEAVIRGTGQHDDVIGFSRLEGSASGGVDLNDVGRFLDGAHIGEPVLVHADLHLAGQGFPVGSGNPNRADSFTLDGEADAAAEVVEVQIQSLGPGDGDEQIVVEGTGDGRLGGREGHGHGRPVAGILLVIGINGPEGISLVVVEIRQGPAEFHFPVRLIIGGHKWGGAGVPVEQVDHFPGVPADGSVLLEGGPGIFPVGIAGLEDQVDIPFVVRGGNRIVFGLAGGDQDRHHQDICFFHVAANRLVPDFRAGSFVTA